MFLILTGARRNKVLYAKWPHFDFGLMSWIIPLSKSGKTHHLQTLLESIPRMGNSEYVFPGKPFKNIYQSWNTARINAGLKNVRMHDLRHTFASTLVNAGVPLHNIQLLLGHYNISVTQRYAHLSKDLLTSSANIAAALLPDMLTLLSPDSNSGTMITT